MPSYNLNPTISTTQGNIYDDEYYTFRLRNGGRFDKHNAKITAIPADNKNEYSDLIVRVKLYIFDRLRRLHHST